jgi:uncharacterized protein
LASEQGFVVAQTFLGDIFNSDKEGMLDRAEVAKWYELAAEQEDTRAQNNLAIIYYTDNGL